MLFDSCDCKKTVMSVDEFFNGLDPVKQKVCEILKTFGDDAEEAYKAAIYIWNIPDFPAKQSVVANCMVNVMDAINEYSEDILKGQVFDALKMVDFVKESEKSDSDIKNVITSLWNKDFKKLYDEKAKMRALYMDRNPLFERIMKDDTVAREKRLQIKQEFEKKVQKINSAKRGDDSLNSCRHLNIKFHKISDSEFVNHIRNIENYILELDSPLYLEKKEVLDGILESTNTKSD